MPLDPRTDPQTLLEHAARVRALARALVLDPHEALDIEQTAWRRALEAPSATLAPAWLSAIVRNVARSRWREQARRRERERRVAAERAPIPTPAEVLEREELKRRLVEHVLALEEPWRTTLVLHYLEERSLREVAAAMGVPPDTARTRVKRGLEQLRARLRRESGDGWAVVFVTGLDLDLAPPSAAAGGVLAVGAASKVVLTAALGVAALAILLVVRSGSPATPVLQLESAPPRDVATELALAPTPAPAAETARAEAAELQVQAPATASAPPTNAASVHVRVLWARDRAPAPGVWVELRSSGDRAPELQLRRVRTDESGAARFEDVSVGHVRARSDRGPSFAGEVEQNKELVGEILLGDGYRLRGDVVDELGRPVSDADIWLECGGHDGKGFPVARSGVDGRFEVVGLFAEEYFSVGARKAGLPPTAQHMLFEPATELVEVRLRFRTGASTLRVSVRDDSGAPVEGAVACLGEPPWRASRAALDDPHLSPPPSLRERSDRSGEIVFDGAALGPTELCVRAPDLAPWSGQVVIGRESELSVALERAPVLRGRVLDPRGAPLAGARVAVGPLGEFLETVTKSAADGSFVLRGLPVGTFKATAHSVNVGSVAQEFHAAPGAELEWVAQLPLGGVIHGRIVAPQAELEGLVVVKFTSIGGAYEQTVEHVDAQGRFRFTGCADTPAELTVRESGESVAHLARVLDVRPSEEELVIELDHAQRPSVRLRGRVVDERGEPLVDVEVSPFSPLIPFSPIEHVDPQTARFDLGPYPPGAWGLVVNARGRPALRLPMHTLAPEQVHDFGDITVGSGGVLAVAIVRDSAVTDDQVTISLTPLDEQLASSFGGRGPLLHSTALAPGRYQIQASSSDGLSDAQQVEVLSGGEATVEVRLKSASKWSAVLVDAQGAPLSGYVMWTAANAAGETVAHGFESFREGALLPAKALPAGELEIALQMQAPVLVGVMKLPADFAARSTPVRVTLR